MLSLAVVLFASGIAEANNAPTANGTIPAQTVNIGGTATTVDVSSYFSDPDGDTLTYTATSSDEAKATVSVSSATVTITAVAAGTATINRHSNRPRWIERKSNLHCDCGPTEQEHPLQSAQSPIKC